MKKKEHVPIRTCKGCGRKAPKSELIRLVWHEGALQEDLNGRMSGRGMYICNRERCRNRLVKNKKMLRRAFRLHG
ncbi:YlxR family protein [Desulfobulbus sp. TB]|nr:YlxR family protein [Desulfobulbus sp. TB]